MDSHKGTSNEPLCYQKNVGARGEAIPAWVCQRLLQLPLHVDKI